MEGARQLFWSRTDQMLRQPHPTSSRVGESTEEVWPQVGNRGRGSRGQPVGVAGLPYSKLRQWPGPIPHPWPHPYTSSAATNTYWGERFFFLPYRGHTSRQGLWCFASSSSSKKAFRSFPQLYLDLLNLPICLSSSIKQQHKLTWLSHSTQQNDLLVYRKKTCQGS